MSLEESKAVVRRFFDEFANKGISSAIDEILSPDFVMHTADGPDVRIEQGRRGYPQFRESFPDVTYTIEDMIAEGDRVAFRMTIEGTHLGRFMNVAPTGRKIRYSRFGIIRLEHGKWAEGWVLTNQISLLQQLGAIPPTSEIGR